MCLLYNVFISIRHHSLNYQPLACMYVPLCLSWNKPTCYVKPWLCLNRMTQHLSILDKHVVANRWDTDYNVFSDKVMNINEIIGRSKGLPQPQIFSVSCSFWKVWQNCMLAPPGGFSTPSSGESWIHPGDSSLDLGIEMTLCDLSIDYIQHQSGFDLGDYYIHRQISHIFWEDIEIAPWYLLYCFVTQWKINMMDVCNRLCMSLFQRESMDDTQLYVTDVLTLRYGITWKVHAY